MRLKPMGCKTSDRLPFLWERVHLSALGTRRSCPLGLGRTSVSVFAACRCARRALAGPRRGEVGYVTVGALLMAREAAARSVNLADTTEPQRVRTREPVSHKMDGAT